MSVEPRISNSTGTRDGKAKSETASAMLLKSRHRTIVIVLLVSIVGGIGVLLAAQRLSSTPISRVRIVNRFPHDPNAFTQGLVIADGQLYEGTGQYGRSTLRRVNIETGEVKQSLSLNREYFGEGICVHGDVIYQLTWKKRRVFLFDRKTFQFQTALRYAGEGWGITSDGTNLIMSDGSSRIRFMDPETFKEVRRITVLHGRRRVEDLNELEYVNGQIWANIWYNDSLARIDPVTGRVVGWIDMSNLWPQSQRPSRENVLNGIAYEEATGRILVTGKNWPQLFEVALIEN